MVVPHYTYLVLKMPSPTGVLSLQGDLKISFDCDTEAVELTATNQVPNAIMEIYVASKKIAPSELDIREKSDKANKPQPSEEVQVKAIDLGTGDSSKTTMIGATLTRNRKTRSSTSRHLRLEISGHARGAQESDRALTQRQP
jgi:hypothetical protein